MGKCKLGKLRITKVFSAFLLVLSTLVGMAAIAPSAHATTVDMAGQTLQFRGNLSHCLAVCPSIDPTPNTLAITAISYSGGTITYTVPASSLTVNQGIIITGTAGQQNSCPEAFGPKQVITKSATNFTVTQTITGSCTTTAASSTYYATPANGASDGSKVQYDYVGNINGVGIDAVVTTTLDTGVTTTYDAATNSSAVADSVASDGYFMQNLGGTSGAGVTTPGASFSFNFYEHGSITHSGATINGTSIVLQNISVTSVDIDSNNQYTDFSGFQSYTLTPFSSAVSITAISSRTALNATITGASTTSSPRAYVFTANNSYSVGDVITVSGMSPSAYNGAFTIASRSATSFTTTTGQTSGGTYSSGGSAVRAATVTYTASNSFTAGSAVNVTDATEPTFNGSFAISSATGSAFTVASSATGSTSSASASVASSHLYWNVSPDSSPKVILTSPRTVRFQSAPNAGSGTNIDADAVSAVYSSVSSITVKIGQSTAGSLNGAYGVQFGPRTWSSGSQNFSNSFNTAPTSANTAATVPGNTATYLTTSNLGGSDSDFADVDSNPFSGIKVTSLPGSGSLEWNNGSGWVSVTSNQTITSADIAANKVRFTGSANTTIGFKVYDGLDYSASAYTLSITVSGLPQTISVTDPGGQAPSTEINLVATSTSNLQVVATTSTPTVCEVTSNLHITFKTLVSNCILALDQAGNGTYAPATTVALTIVVSNAASQNIEFPIIADQTIAYASLPSTRASSAVSKDASGTATNLAVTLATATPLVCDLTSMTINMKKYGLCTITASQSGGSNGVTTFARATPVERSFYIINPLATPAAPTLAAASATSAIVTFTANGSAASHTCKVYSDAGALLQTINPCTSGATITGLSSGGPFKVSITAISNGTTATDSLEGTKSDALTLSFNITASADSHSTISPSGVTSVGYAASQAYTFSASTGYHLDTVLIDGVNNATAVTNGSYTFSNVSTTHTIEVTTAAVTPASLSINNSSETGASGAAFDHDTTITIKDSSGNTITSSSATVTATITSGTGNRVGTYSVNASSGVATFTTFGISGLAGSYTITYTISGPITTTQSITLSAGAASQYLVSSSSYSPTAGSTVTITAQLADAQGNSVATSGKTITWSKSDSNGSFATATSTTDASGTATVVFTTHTASGTATTVTATSSTPTLTGTSSTITTGGFTYSITFSHGTGLGSMTSLSGTGTSVTLTSVTFTKSGNHFNGWLGSNSITYTNGQTVTLDANLTVTLTAQWAVDAPGSGGSTSVGTLQITGTLFYQSAHTISVTVSPSITGSVAFSQNGRPIPGCTAVALNTSTSTATCAWKPANLGSVSITAIFTPKSNLYTTSPAKVISVVIKPR